MNRPSRLSPLAIVLAMAMTVPVTGWSAPKLTVAAGYAGFFRPGEWTPIHVLIENSSEAAEKAFTVQGTLRVKTTPREGDPAIYEQRVDVTQTQRKLFTLYAMISVSRDCQIEFIDAKGKSVWGQDLKTDLTELKDGQKLIVVATEQGKIFGARSSLPLRGARYAHILASSLPDRWYGYGSVDLLVFPEDPGNNLQDATKREALESWITLGGRVVVLGGLNYQTFKNGALKSLLPVEIGEGEEVPFVNGLGETVSLLAPAFKTRPGAMAMTGGGPRPLAARWAQGRGEVVYCGVDLDTPAAGTVPALQMLWDAMVYTPWPRPAGPVADKLVKEAPPTDFGFGRAARLPPVLIIFLLLGTYTALVGPVNLFYLRKKRRMELAWITIPVIVLVFSAMAYTLGFLAKGGLLIVREIETLEGAAGQPLARGEKLACLFSPKKRAYDLECSAKGSALSAVAIWDDRLLGGMGMLPMVARNQPGMMGGAYGMTAAPVAAAIAEAGWPIVLDETAESMRAPERLVAQWSAQNFSTSSAVALPGIIDAEARLSGSTLQVKIRNGLKVPLRGVTLAAAGKGARMGDMAAGEEREVDFVLFGPAGPRDSKAPQFLASLENSAPEEIMRMAGDIPKDQEDNDAVVARHLSARLWQAYARTGSTSGSDLDTVRPKLLAWLDESPAPFRLSGKPDRYAYAGLISLTIPVTIAAGEAQIPANASVSQLVDLDVKNNGGFQDTGEGGSELSDAAAVFAVSPGVPGLPFKVGSALLELQCVTGVGHTIDVSAYNFQTRRWDAMGRDGENFYGREPGEFRLEHLNPLDSTSFLRVDVARTEGWRIDQPPAKIQKIEIGYRGTVQ